MMLNRLDLGANDGVESMEEHFRLLIRHEEREDCLLNLIVAAFKQRVREGQVVDDQFVVKRGGGLRKHDHHHLHRAKLVEHVLNLRSLLIFLRLFFLAVFIVFFLLLCVLVEPF